MYSDIHQSGEPHRKKRILLPVPSYCYKQNSAVIQMWRDCRFNYDADFTRISYSLNIIKRKKLDHFYFSERV